MRVAMIVLSIGAIVGGVLQLPFGIDEVITKFLAPSFQGSALFAETPSDGLAAVGLILGAVLGLGGIAIAYRVWVSKPGTAASLRERLAAPYRLFVNKWYFDELNDAAVVRPALAVGRFAQQTFERIFVDGVLIGGTTGVVRAGSSAVRAAQSGFLRFYAAALLVGLTGVALYFLIVSS